MSPNVLLFCFNLLLIGFAVADDHPNRAPKGPEGLKSALPVQQPNTTIEIPTDNPNQMVTPSAAEDNPNLASKGPDELTSVFPVNQPGNTTVGIPTDNLNQPVTPSGNTNYNEQTAMPMLERQNETIQPSVLNTSRLEDIRSPIQINITVDSDLEDVSITRELKPENITLVVMGRSGMGVSSTVRSIIGKNKTIDTPTGNQSAVTQFLLKIPNQEGLFFKIADVDGLVDGKTIDQDAATLSTLKAYLIDPMGLNGKPPNYFIIVSNFDDDRFAGEKSLFVEVIKRAANIQKAIYNTTTQNNLFILTKLMSSTKTVQRRPTDKLQLFANTIRGFSNFPEPIRIVVAENLGPGYDLHVDDGFTKLPNGDRYPENIYGALINISTLAGDTGAVNSLTAILADYANVGQVRSEFYNPSSPAETRGVLTSFLYLGTGNDTTEISSALQLAFQKLNNSAHYQSLVELLRHFERNNLTRIEQLPEMTFERVKFFQNLPGINSQKVRLIREAFNLSMPEFFLNPFVGYGFDIAQDDRVEISPFLNHELRPSKMGYFIPDFLTCVKITEESNFSKDFASFPGNLKNYVSQRYRFLGFQNSSAISNMKFTGKVKFGFNLEPETPTSTVSLSALQEIRKFECRLNDGNRYTDEFKGAIKKLTPFNPKNRNSVQAWRAFFNDYGTHVVSRCFLGGYMEGYLIGRSLREIINDPIKINQTLDSILGFRNESLTERPTYHYFGGFKNPALEFAADLNLNLRENLLNQWEESLAFDPVVLQYELELTPMHVFAKDVNFEIGGEVERAANLLLQGKLEYIRPTRRPGTPKPTILTKPTPTPTITTSSTQNPITDLSTSNITSSSNFPYWPPANSENPTTRPETIDDSVNSAQNSTSPVNPSNFADFEHPGVTVPVGLNASNVGCEQTGTGILTREDSDSTEVGHDRILCNGYHMLKETLLKSSAFDCNGLGYQREKEKETCALSRSEDETIAEYVHHRFTRVFKLASIPPNPERHYNKCKIMRGTVIRNPSQNKKKPEKLIEVHTDFAYSKFSPQSMKSKLNSEFLEELRSLPSFYYLHQPPDCPGREKWREFFDRYGTHYIHSYSSGFYYESNRTDFQSKNNCEPCHPSDKPLPEECGWNWKRAKQECAFVIPGIPFCEPKEILTFQGKNIVSGKKRMARTLESTFEFVSYATILASSDRELSGSVAEAMYQLVDNNLACL